MSDPSNPLLDSEGPAPAAAPGPIVQSAAIGFRVVYIVTLLLAVLWLGSNFRIISSDSQAVVMQYGRVTRVQKSGLLLAWPRPIEQVRMLPGSERKLSRQVGALLAVPGIVETSADAGAAPLSKTAAPYLTGDGNVVMLDAVLNYRISDPVAYVLSQDHVAPAVDRMFRAAAVQVAAGQKLNDFLVAEPTAGGNADATINATRQAVRDRLINAINSRLKILDRSGQSLGIEVQRIDLTAQLPPQAKLAYDAVLLASQKAEQNIAGANTAAENRRNGAEREADRLVSAAQAAATERTVQATVDTTSIAAIERAAGGSSRGLEEQAFRNNIGAVLARAGNVVVVDPNSGQRVLMSGPGVKPK